MAQAALSEPMNALQELLLQHSAGKPQKQGLRVGALNAGSVINEKRSDAAKRLIQNKGLDIFAIIETWLRKDAHTGNQWDLEGYSYVRKDRRYGKKQTCRKKTKTTEMPAEPNSNAGGGILIYIRESVNYKVKSRGEYAESNVEFLHIEITSPVQLHLVALYSPEKILVDHLISLMSYFMDPLGERKIMFIGDTNINTYGDAGDDKLGNTFFRVLSEKYGVKQCIDHTTHGKACIDHIFTNLSVLESGVMTNSVTGAAKDYHNGIYCTLQVSEPFWVLKNELSKRLQQFSSDIFILAIFCDFEEGETPLVAKDLVLQFVDGVSSAYCMELDEDEIDDDLVSVRKVIDEIEEVNGVINKQWTIFTKSSNEETLDSLRLTMETRCTSFTWIADEFQWEHQYFDRSLSYEKATSSETSYDEGEQDKKAKVQKFMKKLRKSLRKQDTCILAVFYQFSSSAPVPNTTSAENHVEDYPYKKELACYIEIDDAKDDTIKKKLKSIKHHTKEVQKANNSATYKQCIIFTRHSQSAVFHALQKKMWYKGWDFVWQPRHVEFLGYVLEPSLTYAYRKEKEQLLKTTWDDSNLSEESAIALQECTYRYWSENRIERM